MKKPREEAAGPVVPLTAWMAPRKAEAPPEPAAAPAPPTPAAIQGQCEALVSRYADGARRLDQEILAATRACPDHLVGLALVVAREIMSHGARDQGGLLESVDHALRAVGEDAPRVLRLGHADCDYLRARRGDLSEELLELRPDPTLESCEFILETPRQVIDGTLGARLEAVQRKLLAVVRDALSPPVGLGEGEGAC